MMLTALLMLTIAGDCGSDCVPIGRLSYSSDDRAEVEKWATVSCAEGEWRREGGVTVSYVTTRRNGVDWITARYTQTIVRVNVLARNQTWESSIMDATVTARRLGGTARESFVTKGHARLGRDGGTS